MRPVPPGSARIVVGVCATALVLGGCGGSDGDEDVPVLSEKQARGVLLSAADFDGNAKEQDAEGKDDDALGCLSQALADIGEPEKGIEVEQRLRLLEGSEVFTAIAGYADGKEPEAEFDQAREALADCTEIDQDVDGGTATGSVTTSETTSSDRVDEQLNVSANLTIRGSGRRVSGLIVFVISRVGNHLGALQVSGQGALPPGGFEIIDTINDRFIDRLADAVAELDS